MGLSKKAIYHDAHADFTAQVVNYTRTNDALKVPINPGAGLLSGNISTKRLQWPKN
jgi:hypothetical protein